MAMIASVEIADERTADGWPWVVSWTSREDSGIASSYAHACAAVGEALDREHTSREIHSYYESRSGRNSGD